MPDPREKRVELILRQLDQLPTLPAIAVRVLDVTARDDSDVADVVALLESDPALSARLLQLVRRAELGSHVDTVSRAVKLLGFDAVRSAVLALSVFQTFGRSDRRGSFDRDEFWKHSLAVACCAELLTDYVKDVVPSTAFVAGLLHDLGKVALDAMLPKSFDRVVEGAELLRGNIADLERNMIGLDHLTVGKRLCERWQLPTTITETAWLHGQTPAALPPTVRHPRLVNLITLADLIVREQHLGFSGNYVLAGKTDLIAALGLQSHHIDDVLKKLVNHIEPRATALGLGRADADELYRSALSRANQELGRITDQLTNRNRRLLARTKYFDALGDFQAGLKVDGPPQDVLKAIARSAVEVLGTGPVAAFGISPQASFAEATAVDAAGEVFDVTVIDCPVRPPRPADGPVVPAGDELDWLLAALSPRLAESNRYWLCLESDGACVGGVLWGAAPGESIRLGTQTQELSALIHGWTLALRTAQIRDESRALAESLVDANRKLASAQDELMRSRTMQSVGEMAAGAAHEMNNPLAVISGRAQLLVAGLTDPKLKHAAQLIADHSQRVSQIITELMDYARPSTPVITEVDPADLVGRALHEAKMASESADITIETTATDNPPVRVDPSQVTAALVELIDNAVQSTQPGQGHVSVHTAHEPATGQVVVTIADNGCGMDDLTLRHAFDPFFSAKPAGRRRGLGLAKALRWIEASGGTVRLQSRPGQGTRTVVALPAVAESVEELPATYKAVSA